MKFSLNSNSLQLRKTEWVDMIPVIPEVTGEPTEDTETTLFKFKASPFSQEHTPCNQSKVGETYDCKNDEP